MANERPHTRGNMDIRQHKETFDLFWGLTKYGSIAVILLLIFMAVFLVK
jgi:hypothetical protein